MELVVDCANVVVVGVAPGCCDITVGAASETGRVVEIVDAIEDLASNFGEFVVDGAALEVCSVPEVMVKDFVVEGAALEVCSVVRVMVEDLVVDGAALEVGFVAEVKFGEFVVDGAALEVDSVAEVKSDDIAVTCAVLGVCCVVDVMLLYGCGCDDPEVAISHITVQAELSVCILFGTDVQILRVDPCMIGKPLES